MGLAIVECCAGIVVDGSTTPAAQAVLEDAIRDTFGFNEDISIYVLNYFDRCCDGGSEDHLSACLENSPNDYRSLLLQIAIHFADANSSLHPQGLDALRELAERIGLDIDEFLAASRSRTREVDVEWWSVLGVSRNGSFDEVTAAYRRLVVENHPDHQHDEAEKGSATARLKRILAAFERAKQEHQGRPKSRAESHTRDDRAHGDDKTNSGTDAPESSRSPDPSQAPHQKTGTSRRTASTPRTGAESPDRPDVVVILGRAVLAAIIGVGIFSAMDHGDGSTGTAEQRAVQRKIDARQADEIRRNEAIATRRLSLAKQLIIKSSKTAARGRLKQIIATYPKTKAAAEARKTLDGLE